MTSSNQQTLEHSRNLRARTDALAAVEEQSVTPTGVVHYNSRGRVLVVGGEQAQWFAARLEEPLHAELLLTDGAEEPGVPTTSLGGRPLRIDGHLGAFRIELGEHGKHSHQLIQADLVVDFGATPLIERDLPPPGYWHFGCEPQDLDAAMLALDGMTGTFEKPRYFDYDPSICAHSRAGQAGCRRCIDSCPADAIISIGEQVEVNPNLCQGGGICATVCPSGAMRYAYPSPADTATRIRTLLTRYRDAGGSHPMMLFVAEGDAVDMPAIPPNVLLVPLEELASAGHELWLAAIAWGAECVLLADGGSVPPKARHALDDQIAMTHGLLQGLGYPTTLLRSIQLDNAPAECTPSGALPTIATFGSDYPKRQLANLAIEHLIEQVVNPPARIPLTGDAPYGRVLVDTEQCTLCMACTSVCPAGALSAGGDSPQLILHEPNCVQCGICANACPEDAITLEAGWLTDPEQRRKPVVLHEEPPFCCIGCGKPFATRRVIDNILDKLADHAMFQSDRARRRLQMCEDCRVVDAVQDEDAMDQGLFGVTKASEKSNRPS